MLWLVLPLLLVLVTAGMAWAVVLWRRRGRGGAGADLATCGRCGYAVAGLTTFTCPECGSDLRDVGIVRARNAPRPATTVGPLATFMRVVGWKLAVFGVAYTAAAAFAIDYYVTHVYPVRWAERQVFTRQPQSGAYKGIAVTLRQEFLAHGTAGRRHPDVAQRQVTVDLDVGADRHTFVRDVVAGTNNYRDAGGVARETTVAVSQELRRWMTDHGVKNDRPQVGVEMDHVALAITQAAQQGAFWETMINQSAPYFQRDGAETASTSTSASAPEGALGAGAAVLGIGVLAAMTLRNRRRLAAALAEGRGGRTATAAAPEAAPAAPTVRTLTVMFSDVKDYTARTAGESRLGILDLARRHRDLAQPIVARRGGRVVKSMGDGLLVAFESATDAVLAGVEIQAAAAAHNRDAFAERDKVELRVGVSTGEVAIDGGGDVFGEAVNLASRAQQQAGAGEVVFTEATWGMVNRREVRFADAGAFELKGVAGAVRLYRAVAVAADAPVIAPVASEPDTRESTAGKPAR